MCRFLAYLGTPVLMHDLLFEGENSLIQQSRHALERAEPINGDGFGVGFYVPEINPEPAVVVSITPAWNNRNLRYNSARVRSRCVFGHVRAAAFGDVSESNCHPFHYRRLLMMHNGVVGAIKRLLRRDLSDEVYHWIKGETDSEHLFAMFLDYVGQYGSQPTAGQIAESLVSTIIRLEKLREERGVAEPSYLNLAVTDGQSVVATRYVSDPSLEPATLYYARRLGNGPSEGEGQILPDHGEAKAALVASERLGRRWGQWRELTKNYLVVIDHDLSVGVEPIAS